MAKTVRKPPSRIRYEQSHPTVSGRVSREFYDRLLMARKDGRSFADVLKLGLGKVERATGRREEARKEGYDDGYKKGYAEAERVFKVTYHCSNCMRLMVIRSPSEREAVDQYMRENGWQHDECPR